MGSGPLDELERRFGTALCQGLSLRPQAFAFFRFFSALRPPIAAAAPAPNSSTPPGAGTGVPPELELVEVDVEVDVDVDVEVELEPPVDVDVLEDELFDDLLDFEDLLDLLDLELFELLVDFVLLLDLQKIKQLLLDLELFENQLVAFASLGVAATTPAVASEAPITAACVILIYCINSSPSPIAPAIRRLV